MSLSNSGPDTGAAVEAEAEAEAAEAEEAAKLDMACCAKRLTASFKAGVSLLTISECSVSRIFSNEVQINSVIFSKSRRSEEYGASTGPNFLCNLRISVTIF